MTSGSCLRTSPSLERRHLHSNHCDTSHSSSRSVFIRTWKGVNTALPLPGFRSTEGLISGCELTARCTRKSLLIHSSDPSGTPGGRREGTSGAEGFISGSNTGQAEWPLGGSELVLLLKYPVLSSWVCSESEVWLPGEGSPGPPGQRPDNKPQR